MNKDTKIYLILTISVILIMAGIYYYKSSSNKDLGEDVMKCIASKSIMYSQTTCVHCKQQKDILGEYLTLFNIIECNNEPLKCKNILATPSWEINRKIYEGVMSVRELKKITGC